LHHNHQAAGKDRDGTVQSTPVLADATKQQQGVPSAVQQVEGSSTNGVQVDRHFGTSSLSVLLDGSDTTAGSATAKEKEVAAAAGVSLPEEQPVVVPPLDLSAAVAAAMARGAGTSLEPNASSAGHKAGFSGSGSHGGAGKPGSGPTLSLGSSMQRRSIAVKPVLPAAAVAPPTEDPTAAAIAAAAAAAAASLMEAVKGPLVAKKGKSAITAATEGAVLAAAEAAAAVVNASRRQSAAEGEVSVSAPEVAPQPKSILKRSQSPPQAAHTGTARPAAAAAAAATAAAAAAGAAAGASKPGLPATVAAAMAAAMAAASKSQTSSRRTTPVGSRVPSRTSSLTLPKGPSRTTSLSDKAAKMLSLKDTGAGQLSPPPTRVVAPAPTKGTTVSFGEVITIGNKISRSAPSAVNSAEVADEETLAATLRAAAEHGEGVLLNWVEKDGRGLLEGKSHALDTETKLEVAKAKYKTAARDLLAQKALGCHKSPR
jgi:hypothetical protein